MNKTSHGYTTTRGSIDLRKAIVTWYEKTYGVKLAGLENVLPLLGSKEGIAYISLSFLNPGDGALIPNPGYPPYTNVTKLVGCRPLHYDLTEENNWLPDFEKIEKMDLTRVKLMWVNYPHMPTGTRASSELFEKLVRFARSKKILLINDNPYSLVLNPNPLSLLSFDPKLECALELNSMSKAFNMPGWRVGMAIGSKSVIDTILQVKSNVDSGMFLPIQVGATEALANSTSWHDERNKIYKARQSLVFKIFDQLKFTYNKNQVGLFVWAKAPESVKDIKAFVDRILHEAHVFFVPGFIFGTNGEGFVRASICATEEKLEEVLERLKNFREAV
jgi:aspartate/methionine/tyrosine aminotransferase